MIRFAIFRVKHIIVSYATIVSKSNYESSFYLTVSLEGISRFAQSTPPKFVGFFLTVEKDFSDVRQTGNYDEKVGRFHISASAMTKFSEKCQNLVTHTSSFPKNEIMVTMAIV